jgi:hypothetical protein
MNQSTPLCTQAMDLLYLPLLARPARSIIDQQPELVVKPVSRAASSLGRV